MADGDVLRILISTDNHLGVWEKDEVRKDDSFEAFEEVLQAASRNDVDAVLLGGDLFHENKPSRSTLVKAIQIVTRHCLGDRPVSFQILSDQAANFVGGRVNYQDPNLNVSLPIFTIHGNHDDPSGADNLSAVDILSSCKLVNYFGKHLLAGSTIGKVTLSPILMQKGNTRLAVYGLGSIRDERLARLFAQAGMVSWHRPQPTADFGLDDWVNLMVLHQNRVERGAHAKNSVQESHLPAFLDVVIWGHEHECKPDSEDLRNPDAQRAGKPAKVLQPGSTVVTSLSEGESKRKHYFILEVKDNAYRIIKYPLETVRPFVFESVALREQEDVRPEDPETINRFLEAKVLSMMEQASRDYSPPPGTPPKLPLIRLRVDYTGFSTINAQRFGQKFVGKVANPQDLLIWHKAATRKAKTEGAARAGDEGDDILRPEALDQQRIEDLVASNLSAQLRVLHEEDLAVALHNFVEKDDKTALADVLVKSLQDTARPFMKNPAALGNLGEGEGELEEALDAAVQKRRDEKAARIAAGLDPEEGPAPSAAGAGPSASAGGGRATASAARAAPSTMPYSRGGAAAAAAAGGAGDEDGMAEDDADPLGFGAAGVAGKPPAGAGGRRKAAATPAARGKGSRGGKGAAAEAAASGLRQPSLFEAFGRTASQATGAGGAADTPLPAAGAAGATGRGDTQATQGSVKRGGGAKRATGRAGAKGKAPAAAAAGDEFIDSDDEAPAARGGGRAGRGAAVEDEDEDFIEQDEPQPSTARQTRGSTRPAAKRARTATRMDSDDDAANDDSDEYEGAEDDEDEDDKDDSEDVIESDDDDGGGRRGGGAKSKAKSKAAGGSRAKRATPSKAAAAGGRGRAAGGAGAGGGGGGGSQATNVTGAAAGTQQEASVGGRKRPASFMSVGATAAAKPAGGAARAKNWGNAR